MSSFRTLLPIPCLSVLCLLGFASTSAAQSPERDVRAVLDLLFDGMRAGDSTMVRRAMHPEAIFRTIDHRNGGPSLETGSVAGFIEAVGSPHDALWDERISDVEIRVDGPLAQAWMQYAFWLGDALSHCGVNAMELFHDGSDWRIIHVTDTRRSDGCPP
jgi:hypothetical protein